jgi:scyllo-inositol 2-dehydrogenase (NADP+)
MRSIVVGLGIQGSKRLRIAGDEAAGTVDPINPKADFKTIFEVPLTSYDAALVCTPDDVKFELLNYLVKNQKHVLVEKPLLTKNSDEIKKLNLLAKENRVTVYTAYNHRFEPHFMALKKAIEGGSLGKIHMARFFYGNGTARDVRNSAWRDTGHGVLPDLGSHLLDTALFLFGGLQKMNQEKFAPWSFNTFENKSLDHFIFGSEPTKISEPRNNPLLIFEATLLSWRNSFTADVYGDMGSAHINSLCKWGPSTFTLRKRVLPSGKPDQDHHTLECCDPTWALEYDYFKKLCVTNATNLENDEWINNTLNHLASQ